MKLTARGYELREPERPANGKPLYRLHELVSRPDDMVILTEGEHKTDQLLRPPKSEADRYADVSDLFRSFVRTEPVLGWDAAQAR